jgi:hypothetical protein
MVEETINIDEMAMADIGQPGRLALVGVSALYEQVLKRRSVYCFRHTYATFRLMEGVDIYFLAKQMGTSVQMIETHYGHINPVKHAERILVGLPGWAPGPADGTATGAGVHAEAAVPTSDGKGAPKKRVRSSKAH